MKTKYIKIIFSLLIILISSTYNVSAINVAINGPTKACPNVSATYSAEFYTKDLFGTKLVKNTCLEDYSWRVYKDNNGQPGEKIYTFDTEGYQDLTYTFPETPGKYIISVQWFDGRGCCAICGAPLSDQYNIKVSTEIDFSVSPSVATINCGESINLYANSAWPMSFKWSSNSDWSSFTSVSPEETTTYTVLGTGCSGVSITKTSTINVINGPVKNSMSFDGVNDYITAPKYSGLATGNSNFTIEARVKANSAQNVTFPSIFSTRDNSEHGILLFLGVGSGTNYGGKPWFQINGDNHICSSCPSVTDNNVHHIAATRAGDTIKIFVDGVRYYMRSIYPGYGNVSTTGNVRIGHDIGNSSSTYFKGEIAEVRFYQYAKSSSEILTNKDKSAFSPYTLGYWRLNEGSGQVAYNNSYADYSQQFQTPATLGSSTGVDVNDPVWVSNTNTSIKKYYGSSFENAIPLGSISQGMTTSVVNNNQKASYEDDFEYESVLQANGQSDMNNDVFFKITLTQNSRFRFFDCSTPFPHHFVIYNSNRKRVGDLYSEPDDCDRGMDLLAGTYYILFEGTSPWAGAPASGSVIFDINPSTVEFTPVGKMASSSSATDDVAIEVIRVSPNPIHTGKLSFGRLVGDYKLIDTNGQLLKEGKDSNELIIDGLNPGVYILHLDGKTERVIIQ